MADKDSGTMEIEFVTPIKGLMRGVPSHQVLEGYSEYLNNVRPVDTLNSQFRIGQRPGMDKWGAGTQIGGSEQPVVAMCVVSAVV